MRNVKRRGLFLLLALLLTLPVQAMGRGELTYQAVGEEGAEPAAAQTDADRTETSPAREEMIDGIIDRMEAELHHPATVIATGGLARFVTPLCRHSIVYDDDLLLKGLLILYEKNA